MFAFFRRGFTAKIMLIILGISLFAIVITGFGTGGSGLGNLGGLGSSAVASVGGEKVTVTQVQQDVERALTAARAQRPELDMGSFLASGALEQVTDQLIALTAIRLFAGEQGLVASKRLVDQEIASVPAFQNLAGQFDDATFRAALQRENLTEPDLRREISTRILQRQLLLPAAGSAHVPLSLANQYASLLLERRTGTVGGVPAAAMGVGREPTDAEIAAFYRENVTRYTIPERRVLRYAAFGLDEVAARARATDTEIQAFYNQNAATYGAKDARTLSRVVLGDEAAARSFAQKLAQGTSFAEAASQAGFSAADTSVGTLTREAFAQLSSADVAAAAFAAARGATTAPIRSGLGWFIVRVDDIRPTAARPLASVRGEIVTQIEQRKGQEAIGDLIGRIENALADGSTLDEVARAEKLVVRETAPITATGSALGVAGWQTPPDVAPLLRIAFEMEPDEEPVVETVTPNQRMAALAIGRVVPAAAPPLNQIRDRVRSDLIGRRALDRAKAVATSIVSKINAGTPPARAFAEAGMPLPAVRPLNAERRQIAPNNKIDPPLQMLFNLPRGKARILLGANGEGWLVVHVATVTPGDARTKPGLAEAVRGQFAQVMGDEYQQQFTNAARRSLKVERNPDALRQLRRALTGGGTQ